MLLVEYVPQLSHEQWRNVDIDFISSEQLDIVLIVVSQTIPKDEDYMSRVDI